MSPDSSHPYLVFIPQPEDTNLLAESASWDTLLFSIEDCIREQSPATIDLFFASLISLQGEISKDYAVQLRPYLKQLKRYNGDDDNYLMLIFHLFIKHWADGSPMPEEQLFTEKSHKAILRKYNNSHRDSKTEKEAEQELNTFHLYHYYYHFAVHSFPFLAHQALRVLHKLATGDTLPLLATPTHAPFYLLPEVLAGRLLKYEASGVAVDAEDLIVACNRCLPQWVTPEAKAKAVQLKGSYAAAIHYYFGVSDAV